VGKAPLGSIGSGPAIVGTFCGHLLPAGRKTGAPGFTPFPVALERPIQFTRGKEGTMKQDRFLIGILVGIGVLVVAAFVLFFMRQSQMNYVADDTPAGVVQNYVLALHKGDYQKAYGYLAAGQDKPTYDEFRKPFVTKMNSISSADIQIQETIPMDKEAVVKLVFSNNYDGPYNSYRSTEQADLKLENGLWKISSMPQPYWFYDWYQPKVKTGG
jgi:hypothetical protein